MGYWAHSPEKHSALVSLCLGFPYSSVFSPTARISRPYRPITFQCWKNDNRSRDRTDAVRAPRSLEEDAARRGGGPGNPASRKLGKRRPLLGGRDRGRSLVAQSCSSESQNSVLCGLSDRDRVSEEGALRGLQLDPLIAHVPRAPPTQPCRPAAAWRWSPGPTRASASPSRGTCAGSSPGTWCLRRGTPRGAGRPCSSCRQRA